MDVSTTDTPLSPLSKELLSAALVAAQDDPDGDNNYVGAALDINEISETAGVDPQEGRIFLAELIRDGIARPDPHGRAENLFVVNDKPFKAWRKRLGL